MPRVRTSREIANAKREMFFKYFGKHYEEVLEKLFELAMGIKVRAVNEKGQEIVYDRPPDIYAIREIHDRLWGKAQQNIGMEVSTVQSITDLVAIASKRAINKLEANQTIYGIENPHREALPVGEQTSEGRANDAGVVAEGPDGIH